MAFGQNTKCLRKRMVQWVSAQALAWDSQDGRLDQHGNSMEILSASITVRWSETNPNKFL